MFFESYQLYRLAIWLVTRLPLWFVFFVAGTIAETGPVGPEVEEDDPVPLPDKAFRSKQDGSNEFVGFTPAVGRRQSGDRIGRR